MGHDGTHRRTGVGIDLLPARAQILRYALPNQNSGTPATGEAGKSLSERGKRFCAAGIILTAFSVRLVKPGLFKDRRGIAGVEVVSIVFAGG